MGHWDVPRVHHLILLIDEGVWEKGEIHIFSDSDYSIGGINGTTKPRTNLDLYTTVKKKLTYLTSLGVEIFLHWVKAHCGIDYNEKADELAGEANEDSEAGLGPDFLLREELVLFGDRADYDNTEIVIRPTFIDNG